MAKARFIAGTPNRPEFGDMFGGWLTFHEGRAFLVDCGVGSGGATLAARLAEALDGRPLDYVLLTHIHLDHSGGLAEIMKRWPAAKVVAHAKGLRHLADPARLWAGTQKVMGELAPMYETEGGPTPIPPANLIAHDQAGIPGLVALETPGHAQHHVSYRLGEAFFAGEAAGCPFIFGGRLYTRPATPPRYFHRDKLASLALLRREKTPRAAYFAHTHENLPFLECVEMAEAQLRLWEGLFRSPAAARRPGEGEGEYLGRMTDLAYGEDDNMKPLTQLSAMGAWRERYFMRNSVQGFLQFLAEEGGER